MENTTDNDDAIISRTINTTGAQNPLANLTRSNPLSNLSSYTYNLTLYMVTPETANYFTQKNRLPPSNSGATQYFIVAKSGGLNDADPRGLTFDPTNPGSGKKGLDFFIDDLNIEVYMLAQDGSKTATVANKISFKVIEPEGFTFLTKLSELSAYINSISPVLQATKNDINLPNLYQQHYILAIKFYGYNADGSLSENNGESTTGDKYALFERFFPVVPQNVTFRLVPKNPIVYNWEGVVLPGQVAFGEKNGTLKTPLNIQGTTVGEILGSTESESSPTSLIGWLNTNQQKLKNDNKLEKPTKYEILWLNKDRDGEIKSIYTSKMADNQINEKTPTAPVQSTKDVTVQTSTKSNQINTASKSINVPYGKSIVSTIDQIIINSQYVKEKATVATDAGIETKLTPKSKGPLVWYAIKPLVTCNGRDSITNDWAYNITYEVSGYDVPYVKNQFVIEKTKYYGPIKRYNYIFTGQNTEIINYEQEYNNIFYNIIPPSAANTAYVGANGVTPVRLGKVNADISMGTNNDNIIATAVRASLYSIKDSVKVNLKILGDPDFLMDSIGSASQPGNISKFFSINNSINPYAGQIFIEINFGVAEDYGSDGLMDLDPKKVVGFYPEADRRAINATGVVYRINKVDSYFTRGKFEQNLELYLVFPGDLVQTTIQQRESIPDAATTRGLLNAADKNLISVPASIVPTNKPKVPTIAKDDASIATKLLAPPQSTPTQTQRDVAIAEKILSDRPVLPSAKPFNVGGFKAIDNSNVSTPRFRR